MLELGTRAPDFALPEPVSGRRVQRTDYIDQPLLVVFSCNHCPYVLHILESFTKFANHTHDLAVVMINANDVARYPDDSPEKMIELATRYGFDFPYLYDELQQVAIAYRAACTPDFFLFDQNHYLVYRGQYDAARPGNSAPVNGVGLKTAVDALLQGIEISSTQTPSMGCNIKWRTGHEPDYF